MTDIEKRIKLAEWRGWVWAPATNAKKMGRWSWKGMTFDWSYIDEHLPDPFTDERHCHALIKHLNRLGYSFRIEHWSDLIGSKDNFYPVEIEASNPFGNGYFTWQGDNWMEGVCELALKVIGDGR